MNISRLLFQYGQNNATTITSVCLCQYKYKCKITTFILYSELFNKGQVQAETLKKNYWILFPLERSKLTPILCGQVTQCLGSLTFSLVGVASINDVSTKQGKK